MQSARKRIGKASMVLLIIYGAIVLYYVLFSERLGRADAYDTLRYNLHPFEEIRRFIVYREYVSPGAFVLNLLGNIFVFSPFGFLLPLYRLEKTGPVRVMLYSFLFSLGIELLQLVTRVGVFDVDDLILNTLGGLIGFLVYKVVFWIYHRNYESAEDFFRPQDKT